MQTYTHRQGETPELITLTQDDGTPYDLSGCTITLRVHDGVTCIIVPVTLPDPILGQVLPDGPSLDALSPRVRRAVLHVAWPDSTVESAPDFALNIVEAC